MDHLSKTSRPHSQKLSGKHLNLRPDNSKRAITANCLPVVACLPRALKPTLRPDTSPAPPASSPVFWTRGTTALANRPPSHNHQRWSRQPPKNDQANTCCTGGAERKKQACNRIMTHFQCTGKSRNGVLLATTNACPILGTVQ